MKEDFRRRSVMPDCYRANKREAIPRFEEANGGSQKRNCAIHQNAHFVACLGGM